MKRLRLFKISAIPATNFKPARVRIIDMYNNARVIVSYTASGASDSVGRGAEYLQAIGFNIVADSFDNENNHYFLSDTWGEIPLKGAQNAAH